MKYAVKPPGITAIPIKNSDAVFPVRRVYCVGRNYNDHVAEMGGTPGREPPFFFQKPADAIVTNGRFPYPSASAEVHHELELVVALASGGVDIASADAMQNVFGYAIGLDMTRRDLQAQLKKGGRPWEAAKAFDHSAPVSAIVPTADTGGAGAFGLSLALNGVIRQKGSSSDMIWSVAEIICELSKLFELAAGDVIFTGTPSGVGSVQRGDVLAASLTGFAELTVTVV